MADDGIDRRYQEVTRSVAHDVDVVRAGLDHLGDAAEGFAFSVDDVETHDLEAIVLALFEGWEIALGHLEQAATKPVRDGTRLDAL